MNPADAPFLIEHRRVPLGDRDFRPEATLLLTPGIRTSGLLEKLTPDTALPLLTLLSFLTPNGRIAPTLHEIGQARGLSPSGVRDFMEPLTQLVFDGSPLAIPRLRESGMDGYLLSPKAAAHVHKVIMDAHLEATGEPVPEPLGYVPAGREAIVAASRAKYARPRAEVEREIEEALGHDPREADASPEGEARRRLYSIGVPRDEIESLLTEHSAQEALQQLDWLPQRGAKSPARFVVAAIRGNYEPPAGFPSPELASEDDPKPSEDDPKPVDVTTTVEVSEDLPDIRWDLQ